MKSHRNSEKIAKGRPAGTKVIVPLPTAYRPSPTMNPQMAVITRDNSGVRNMVIIWRLTLKER